MILAALESFYLNHAELPKFGFDEKRIPFLITLSEYGEFISMEYTGEGNPAIKPVGAYFTVPSAVKRTSAIAANLLWDNPAYVFGEIAGGTKAKQGSFIQNICAALAFVDDSGASAVVSFLSKPLPDALLRDSLWLDMVTSRLNVTFKLAGTTYLACQSLSMREYIAQCAEQDEHGAELPCLVRGAAAGTERLHGLIRGVPGSQASGASLVSFNLPAFNSYGCEQGANAPISKRSAFAYTTALNYMLRKDSAHKMRAGNTMFVFWSDQADQSFEDVAATLFGDGGDNTEPAPQALSALLAAPRKGMAPLFGANGRFHLLGLTPNAGRIAISQWRTGRLNDFAVNIINHFADCEVESPPHHRKTPSVHQLLSALRPTGLEGTLSPRLYSDVIDSIFSGSAYPDSLYKQSLLRLRVLRGEPDYMLHSMIKGVLNRRLKSSNIKERALTVSLDIENTAEGYLLGRLFALLEKTQTESAPNLNQGIRDRFYNRASLAPLSVYPSLIRLSKAHLRKVSLGRSKMLDAAIESIVSSLSGFPARLDMKQQGLFAIGYYHQRNALYRKHKTDSIQGEQE